VKGHKPGGRSGVVIHSVGALFFCLASVTGAAQPKNPPAQGKVVSYIMQEDDSLYDIAEHYLQKRDDWAMVARLNNIASPERIRPGRTLRLPVALLKQTTLHAMVLTVNGPASYARHNAAFVPLAPGMTLTEGDRIRTGNNGFVTLSLSPDNSHLLVAPNSLLKVSTLRQTVLTGAVDRVLSLQQGGVDSAVTPFKRKDDRFQIRSPSVTAGVRGTHFQMRLTQDGATNIEVLTGAVAVNGDGTSRCHTRRGGARRCSPMQLVTAWHGNVSSADGMIGKPRALLSRPELVGMPWMPNGPEAWFNIRPVKGAQYYHVWVYRDTDAGMIERVRDIFVSDTHVNMGALPDGEYFVRIAAIDANGLEGVPGTYPFRWRCMSASTAAVEQVSKVQG